MGPRPRASAEYWPESPFCEFCTFHLYNLWPKDLEFWPNEHEAEKWLNVQLFYLHWIDINSWREHLHFCHYKRLLIFWRVLVFTSYALVFLSHQFLHQNYENGVRAPTKPRNKITFCSFWNLSACLIPLTKWGKKKPDYQHQPVQSSFQQLPIKRIHTSLSHTEVLLQPRTFIRSPVFTPNRF